jgi:PPOX class probable F420-dependent enzyme
MSGTSFIKAGDGESPISIEQYAGLVAELDNERVGWLTTVSSSGQPQSSAIWFIREGDTLLFYSADGSTRLGNLEQNSRAAFNLRGDKRGDHVVSLEGRARVDDGAPPPNSNAPYLGKYEREMTRLGWSPETFSDDYPIPVRMDVRRMRAWVAK